MSKLPCRLLYTEVRWLLIDLKQVATYQFDFQKQQKNHQETTTMKTRLIRALLILTIFFTWLGVRSASVFAAGGCNGPTCEGKFASTMGCPAYTSGPVKVLSDSKSTVETRVSGPSDCDAKWARTYNKSGGNRCAAASLRYGCANYCYNQSISSPEKIASSSTVGVHTPMTAYSGTPTRSCGRVSTTGPIPTPIPVSDAECTGAN